MGTFTQGLNGRIRFDNRVINRGHLLLCVLHSLPAIFRQKRCMLCQISYTG